MNMEHYKVYDKDGKLLVSDIAVSIKSDIFGLKNNKLFKGIKFDLISFDTKYFINTKYFKFELVKDNITNLEDYKFDKIKFDIKNFSSYYIVNWSENCTDINAPIYFDNSYDELDPEVEELVHTLNSIPAIITTGSCSGHNKNPLFVTLNIYDFDTIVFLINVINNYFYNDFHLTTDKTLISNKFNDFAFMMLSSKAIGTEAYNKTKELVKIINVNKENIYPIDNLSDRNFDLYRVQVYDLSGNILVDDIVKEERNATNYFSYNYGFISKKIIVRHKYITFDSKYYIDINSKLFKFVFLGKNTDMNIQEFDRIKFNMEKFKKYKVVGFDLPFNTDSPIRVELYNNDSRK